MQPAERSRALHISWIQICEPMPRILHGEVSVRLHTTPKNRSARLRIEWVVAAHGVRKPSADAHHQQRRQRQAGPEAGTAAAAAALQQAASGQQLHAAGEPCAPTATSTAGSRMVPAASAAASSLAGRQPLASTGLLRCWVSGCHPDRPDVAGGPGSESAAVEPVGSGLAGHDRAGRHTFASAAAALADWSCARRGSYIDV